MVVHVTFTVTPQCYIPCNANNGHQIKTGIFLYNLDFELQLHVRRVVKKKERNLHE